MTVTIQIGNSDDKLPQRMWSEYVEYVHAAVLAYGRQIHFSGGSPTNAVWQNYCWVFDIEPDPLVMQAFRRQVAEVRMKYCQDSAAVTFGETLFI